MSAMLTARPRAVDAAEPPPGSARMLRIKETAFFRSVLKYEAR